MILSGALRSLGGEHESTAPHPHVVSSAGGEDGALRRRRRRPDLSLRVMLGRSCRDGQRKLRETGKEEERKKKGKAVSGDDGARHTRKRDTPAVHMHTHMQQIISGSTRPDSTPLDSSGEAGRPLGPRCLPRSRSNCDGHRRQASSAAIDSDSDLLLSQQQQQPP